MYSKEDYLLKKISKSKFRNSFHLNSKLKQYSKEKGYEVIKKHAYDFINKRIKPKTIVNDGKQTPMRQVHLVFIAQHATATCCRKCLYKWHKIPMNTVLDTKQVDYIVDIIMKWIEKEINSSIK